MVIHCETSPDSTRQTYHSADGTTDSIGLELAVEATGCLVNLQGDANHMSAMLAMSKVGARVHLTMKKTT